MKMKKITQEQIDNLREREEYPSGNYDVGYLEKHSTSLYEDEIVECQWWGPEGDLIIIKLLYEIENLKAQVKKLERKII